MCCKATNIGSHGLAHPLIMGSCLYAISGALNREPDAPEGPQHYNYNQYILVGSAPRPLMRALNKKKIKKRSPNRAPCAISVCQ